MKYNEIMSKIYSAKNKIEIEKILEYLAEMTLKKGNSKRLDNLKELAWEKFFHVPPFKEK